MSHTVLEKDEPQNGAIGVLVVLTIALFAVLVVAAMQMHGFAVSEAKVAAASTTSPQLQKLRAEEKLLNERYRWVNRVGGVVRIPVKEAADLVIREWASRPDAPVEMPGLTPTAPPAPPPAPEMKPAKPSRPAKGKGKS